MASTSLKKYLVLISVLVFGSLSWGVENFRVTVPKLKVYAQPSTLSQVITTLSNGQVVQAGSNPAGGFKKVLVSDMSGKKRIGYIALSDLPASARAGRRVTRSRASGEGMHNHWAIGLSGGMAYDTESSRQITDQLGNVATSGTLTGTAPQFGGLVICPLAQQFNVEGYAYYKSSTLSGNYTYSLNPNSAPISITQTFLSVGAMGQYYFSPTGSFFVGPGVQLDWGMTANASLNNNNFTLSTNQFIYVFAGAGYDIGITNSIFLTPELRAGADVNASPMIIEINGELNLAYKF